MTRKFDVIAIGHVLAIGAGSTASAVASRCREAGWQVAIVDSRPFGGGGALKAGYPAHTLT
jgi:glutathione reductase (NADPH)